MYDFFHTQCEKFKDNDCLKNKCYNYKKASRSIRLCETPIDSIEKAVSLKGIQIKTAELMLRVQLKIEPTRGTSSVACSINTTQTAVNAKDYRVVKGKGPWILLLSLQMIGGMATRPEIESQSGQLGNLALVSLSGCWSDSLKELVQKKLVYASKEIISLTHTGNDIAESIVRASNFVSSKKLTHGAINAVPQRPRLASPTVAAGASNVMSSLNSQPPEIMEMVTKAALPLILNLPFLDAMLNS